jgi:hypothetical protein
VKLGFVMDGSDLRFRNTTQLERRKKP